MKPCGGVNVCFHETCNSSGICQLSIDYSDMIYNKKEQNHTTVAGSKSCTQKKCLSHTKTACQIIGQCIFLHPAVVADRKAPGHIKGSQNLKGVIKVLERLMPSLKRMNHWWSFKPETKTITAEEVNKLLPQ